MAESQPLDAEQIFVVLARHQVDYVVIGGIAVQAYGHVRMTNDVDLIPAPTPQNLARLAAALNEIDARILNPGSEHLSIDAKLLPRATLWQISTAHGDVDVLHDAPGATPFDQLRERATIVALGEVSIPIVSRDDLIKMKAAAARPIDVSDIAALTEREHRGTKDESRSRRTA